MIPHRPADLTGYLICFCGDHFRTVEEFLDHYGEAHGFPPLEWYWCKLFLWGVVVGSALLMLAYGVWGEW